MGIEALDGLNAEAPAELVEAVQTPEATPEVVEAPQEPEAPAEVVEPPKDDVEKHVPLATFLDTRDKRKEAEKRAETAEAELAQIRAAKAQPTAPDLYDMKPEEVTAYVERVAEQKALNTKFEMSQVLAQQTHGEDAVKAATDWAMDKAKTDPTFASQYMSNPHPLDFIVRQHKRDAQLAAIGDDPDEYVRRRAVELGLTASTVAPVAAVAQQVPKPAAPPKSLVNAPSQGGVSEVPVGKLAGMETVFPR